MLLLTGAIPVVVVVTKVWKDVDCSTVLVSCMPLLTGAVPAVIVAPTVLVGCMLLQTGAVLTLRRGVLHAEVDIL